MIDEHFVIKSSKTIKILEKIKITIL